MPASLPLRKCGLKLGCIVMIIRSHSVTSLAEVWIEIFTLNVLQISATVTSLAEVWIEMMSG